MAIPDFDTHTGYLPPGRYRCTLIEVEQRFALPGTDDQEQRRVRIWRDFLDARSMYESVHASILEAVWIAGSFTSTKPEPDDIDVTFLLNEAVYESLSNANKKRVSRLSARDGQECHLRVKADLLIDCFAFIVSPVALPWKDLDPEKEKYFRTRGMWDDWWQRVRTNPEDTLPLVEDARAVRGYLEVPL